MIHLETVTKVDSLTERTAPHHGAQIAKVDLVLDPEIELEVRLFDLELCSGETSLVNPAEIEHANRFARDSDRRHFIARRSILRALLSERCGLAPEMINLDSVERRKPSLPETIPLRFNASRSHRWFAVVLYESLIEPGIDIEVLREIPDVASLSRRILSPEETRASGDGIIHDSETLLRFWPRKEAVLKSLGTGLSIDPTQVTVPVEVDLSRGDRAAVRNGDSIHHVTLIEPDCAPDGIMVCVGVADRLIDSIRH